ncbi:MAG: hypothetical protein M3490_04840 [Chloroflexota bacterium]|nr:hypothetical protein [Chloroflexota bacterium]
MSSMRFRWRAPIAPLAIFLLVLTAALPSISLAQTSTAPTGHAQVIAQGVDLMPRVPVAWRMTESQAAPTDEAEFFPRTLGFTIGVDDPILVTDDDSDTLTLLHEGEVSFRPEGASERRSSTTNDSVDYVSIQLIVADAVDSPESVGSSRLTFKDQDFRAPRGCRDLQLIRDVLAPAEEGAISGSGDAPSLLYVSGGALQVTDADGEISELTAGDTMEITGDADLLAGANDGATWLMASIGDAVEVSPAPTTALPDDKTGSLELRLEGCVDGLDADCSPITNRDLTVPAFHLVEDDDNWVIPDRARLSDGDTILTYDDLAAGEYVTMPDDEAVAGVTIDGATWDDDLEGWVFEIEAGETTELTLKVIVDDRGDTGSLLVTLYDCPAGSDPERDSSSCDLTSEPWEVSVADIGQSDVTEWTLADDALNLGDGQYWFELLPPASLTFYPDGAREVGTSDVVVTGAPYVLGNLWAIDIPYHGTAEATLYRVPPSKSDPPVGGTGSLVIYQSDCPYGTDPAVNTSACATSTDPWAVIVTNDATGEPWDLLFDGVAYDTGTYVLEALPAGSYSIFVSSNENWSLSYPTNIDVSADDETYVTVSSDDLRAP